MAVEEHRAAGKRAVACAVVTVSDTRTRENDTSGARIRTLLGEAGHRVASYEIVRDEPYQIRSRLVALLATDELDAVIANGGTGLAPRDTTYEVVSAFLDKRIDGFGELFRMLSYAEVGAAAMLSRAVAGTAGGKLLASLPGSTAAVELAMTKLLIPELGHVVRLLRG